MKGFAEMYAQVERTTRTNEKVAALVRYFKAAPPDDAAWALGCMSGNVVKRAMSTSALRSAVTAHAGIAAWLLQECYEAVGDLSETLALVLPPRDEDSGLSLSQVMNRFVLPMVRADEQGRIALLREAWGVLSTSERFLFHKLISGTFRVGVQKRLLVRALAEVSGLDAGTIAHRLSGKVAPTGAAFAALISPDTADADTGRPYPFCLAHQLDDPPETLGEAAQFAAEWKWDGVRAQVVKRGGAAYVWSRGEELVGEQFPEVVRVARAMSDGTVLDGEVLAWREGAGGGAVRPFQELQRRLGRKDVQPGLFEETGAIFMAFDLLELEGADCRKRSFLERRAAMEEVVSSLVARGLPVRASELIRENTWEEMARHRLGAREGRYAEGLMLKPLDSVYHVGRVRGGPGTGLSGWWKWKLDPFSLDAVLIYAQPGSGRRAGLYTDYTFGLWQGEGESRVLTAFTKAYSGLTDEEIRKVDAFVRRHTIDRHGPVRVVEPSLVFEIGFQQVQESGRHRAGLAVRFPRILKWRHDKKPQDADDMEALRRLLAAVREG